MSTYPEDTTSYSDLDREPPERIREKALGSIKWADCADEDCDGGTWLVHRSGWNLSIDCDECGLTMTYVG